MDTPTDGGIQRVKYIPESDVYRLVMRSKLPQAEQFQDWVCDEVLPAIRKTGGYMSAKETDTPEMIMARAVLVANDTIARQKQQLEQAHKQVAALAPKAELMDKVLDTDQKIDVGQAAKILNLPFGRNRRSALYQGGSHRRLGRACKQISRLPGDGGQMSGHKGTAQYIII